MELVPGKMSDRHLLFLALEQQRKLTTEQNEALRKELRDRIENGRHGPR
jgi:hypothetical protein